VGVLAKMLLRSIVLGDDDDGWWLCFFLDGEFALYHGTASARKKKECHHNIKKNCIFVRPSSPLSLTNK
jgi:hypothetical protein